MGMKTLNYYGKRQLRKFLEENLCNWSEEDRDEIVEKWTNEAEYNAACGQAYVHINPWQAIDGEHHRLDIDSDGVNETDFLEPAHW